MIQLNTLESVPSLVSATKDLKIGTVEGSLLDEVTSAFNERISFLLSSKENRGELLGVDDIINVIKGARQEADYSDGGTGDVLSNKVTEPLKQIVKNNIYVARNIVLPLAERYTEQLNNSLNTISCASGVALTVKEDHAISILENPTIIEAVGDVGRNYVPRVGDLPRVHHQVSDEVLLNLIKTGKESLDNEVHQWVINNNLIGKLSSVYNDVFYSGKGKGVELSKYYSVSDYAGALFIMLLAYGLKRHLQDGLNISIEDYNHLMDVTIVYAKTTLAVAISNHQNGLKRKRLIISFPKMGSEYNFGFDNEIVVVPSVYKEFISAGGEIELIFGSFLTDRRIYLDDMFNTQDAYMQAYNKCVKNGRLVKATKLVGHLQTKLYSIAANIKDDIKDIVGDNDFEFDKNHNFSPMANDFIRGVGVGHVEDLYKTIRDFICKVYFSDTQVLEMLQKIDYLGKEHSDSDLDEIVVMCNVDIIVDWLLSQTTVNAK